MTGRQALSFSSVSAIEGSPLAVHTGRQTELLRPLLKDCRVEYAMRYGRGIDKETCRRFVLMYVNDYTKRLGPDGEAALRRLYDLAHAKGLIREKPPVDPI